MKQESYDVVVVGAGIGGLCAGALLTHAGYRTLVVEKLPSVGGRCSTIEYKGFKLTTGALSLPMGGTLQQIFDDVGAKFDVRPNLLDTQVNHYRIQGQDYEITREQGFRGLISLASKDEEEAQRIIDAIERATKWQEPLSMISLREWLAQYTSNETVFGVFQTIVANHFCINVDELLASVFIRYLREPLVFQHRGFAPGGNIAVMDSLAQAIQRDGGQVWTRCAARRILTANGMVKGVVVDRQGEELEIGAKVVISNTSPKQTVGLAESENFDKGYLQQLRETHRPACFIWISFAADRPLIGDRLRLFIARSQGLNSVRCPTVLCPELAPAGKHLFEVGSIPASSLPPINFTHEVELCLEQLRHELPQFERHGEILRVGCFHGDWPAYHTWSGYDLPQKTPIENLYNVGDGVKPGVLLGTVASAETAWIVVEDIKQRI